MRTFFETYVFAPNAEVAVDLGAGTGCEVRWMAAKFRRFVANEVDETFQRGLAQIRRDTGSTFEITGYNWLDLHRSSLRDLDLAFLLGNSLCLLNTTSEVKAALAGIRSILRIGGHFVVDQRNFDYILGDRAEILRSGFRYSARVIYCGTSVVGRPTAISQQNVDFGYFDRDTGRKIGALKFLPMRFQDLKDLIVANGFTIVRILSDLNVGLEETADFYSFVCRAI